MKIFDTTGNQVASYFSANQGVTNLNIQETPGFELIHERVTAADI